MALVYTKYTYKIAVITQHHSHIIIPTYHVAGNLCEHKFLQFYFCELAAQRYTCHYNFLQTEVFADINFRKLHFVCKNCQICASQKFPAVQNYTCSCKLQLATTFTASPWLYRATSPRLTDLAQESNKNTRLCQNPPIVRCICSHFSISAKK